jgi:hypothetical protein
MNSPNPTSLPEIIQRSADLIVDEYPDEVLENLAADVESDTANQEGLPIARAVAAELRRRAAAGVRKWPGPKCGTGL